MEINPHIGFRGVMNMSIKTVVVGGNFAGLTAALELKRKGGANHEVILVSSSTVFIFIPSLIWVPLKWREIKDITVPIEPVLKKAGVQFVHAEALHVDPENRVLQTTKGDIEFDHVVIATGPRAVMDVAEGFQEHVHYIGTPNGAMKTREALEELKKIPGRWLSALRKTQAAWVPVTSFCSISTNG